ncbi:unnamed protein product [Urochloa humidicola]
MPPPPPMRQPVRSTRPKLRRRPPVPLLVTTVLISMALLPALLCLPVAADASSISALHYHRKHRRHYYHYHRRHRAAPNSSGHIHISLPPAALPPAAVDDGDYSPAEPPGLPPDAPPPSPRHHKPCCSPPPPRAPRSVAPAPAPAMPPSHSSHAKSPSSLSPALSPSHAKRTPCTPANKAPHAQPPGLAPVMPPLPSPARRPPRLPPAIPPAHPPATTSSRAPARPPQLAPAKPPTPSPSPAQPPRPSPAVSAKPPALPPATSKPTPSPPPADKNGSSSAVGNVFDVRAFGASGNGSSGDDARAFRAAWKAACSSSDNSTLLVPSDGVFTITSTIFAGPCKSGLTFQIDGVLMPPDGPASWPAADSRRQWLVFYKADGMTLAGKGTIEGNGEEWWDLPCKPHRGPNGSTLPGPCDSPALIRFFVSNDVAVRGLRIENSPQFHLKFDGCARVTVDGLSVSSPAFSPNTDGVHVENTTDVHILNSRIYNGDDCVSIGAGCSGVHIENITCGHGHGISIGSLGARGTRACVSNVTVRSARVLDSDNGLRIKTWQGGAGAVSGVEFAGVQLRNVRNCIVIDQYYCLAGAGGCANQSSAVRVAGVAYRDVRGTYNPRGGGAPIRLACSDAVACTGITMAGVELVPAAGGDGGGAGARLADPYCWNAYGVMETLTLPPVYCLQEGRPDSLQDQLTTC